MGDQRKGNQKRTPMSGADIPIGLFRSGVWDARDRIKYGQRFLFFLHLHFFLQVKEKEDWELVLSSYDRNAGSYKRINVARKQKSYLGRGRLGSSAAI